MITRTLFRRWPVLFFAISTLTAGAAAAPELAVESVGMTVSDVDRAVEFYSALTFRKVSEVEVLGPEYEHLEGVFGARMRIVRMQLGSEFIDLTQYVAPPGRPIPVDSRSNDRWFQHVAIVVRDMDAAFEKVRAMKAQFVSTAPQTLPPSITAAAGIKAFYFRDPDGHNLELISFPQVKAIRAGSSQAKSCFSGSITPPLASRTPQRACSFIATCWGCGRRARARILERNRSI